jgi:hypothetical protein
VTYAEYLAANRLKRSAASALAWLKSGQAPVGTAIPAALQPQLGGATVLDQSTPGVDWRLTPGQLAERGAPMASLPAGTFNPPPAMPTPAATTINPAPKPGDPYTFSPPQNPYLPQMGLTMQQLLTMPAAFNAQRQQAAAGIAAQLGGQGLVAFQPGQTDYTTKAATDPSGNITYGIVQGGDGKAYLQAFAGIGHGFASRGVASGSMVDAAQEEQRAQLNTQKAQLYNQLAPQQQAITGQEMTQAGDLFKQYADYQSQGAQAANDTVAGWSVPQTFSAQQTAARGGPTIAGSAFTWPTQPTAPSPLTQMTGGQRTITGAAGKTVKAVSGATTRAASSGIGAGKSLWSAAKTARTKSTRLR